MTTILLVIGTVSVSLSIRQLVGNYLLNKTDTQLVQQAELVYNNVGLLSSRDSSQSTAGPTDYFLQMRNTSNTIIATPLVPVLKGGVVSVPTLPANGSMGTVQLGTPFTTTAKVTTSSSSQSDRDTLQKAKAPWRVLALQWMNKSQSGESTVGGVVYIGLSLSDQIDTVNTLTRYTLMVGAAIIMLSVIIATVLIQRTLAPLKRIEKTAAKIAAGDLSERIPPAPENTEVGSLSASLNTMLARIESSFREQEKTTEKMKRFVSDASHELRTPLAAIHGYAELYTMQRDLPGALDRADSSIRHIEDSSTRMTVLVEDLLSLARLDEGRGIDMTSTVDLTAVLLDSSDDLHALDPERSVDTGVVDLSPGSGGVVSLVFSAGAPPAVSISGDPSRIRQVITNIVGNIHRYTPADSSVQMGLGVLPAAMSPEELSALPPHERSLRRFLDAVEVGRSMRIGTTYAVMRFIDHGPGVPDEDRPQIFERFYTADPSRAREKGGTGLGMAIVLSVVKAHKGLIVASESDGGGLTITVILPIAPVERDSAADGGDAAVAVTEKSKRSEKSDATGPLRWGDRERRRHQNAGD
ncbi:HAMP domain-containing sensor histidine kinase [uncultured Bifidobacterium sp.]|uniref:sensor histidine kinase n=1 Tax=uncultured Bifidobacterium sp. TaxID=165187 RepID=UPI00261D4140|nr:HAMP domain-containing sensor histidine kinase [uncultured Bifidobacterium sp.]